MGLLAVAGEVLEEVLTPGAGTGAFAGAEVVLGAGVVLVAGMELVARFGLGTRVGGASAGGAELVGREAGLTSHLDFLLGPLS